jgi:prepilin-type processing-associated H-X9-DG protein/prepilin-type N-terminal cleavage/methylation domain-containing protein
MRALRSGFTLIELLVVVAIIAVIAGLLMAALVSARESGDTAQCANNLRVLAEANIRYAAEHEGRYCVAMERGNNVRWHGERVDVNSRFDPAKGPLAPYLGQEERVKRCPSFREVLDGAGSFEEGSGGYGYNAIYVGGSPANKWQGEHIGNIPAPVRTVMFADTALSRRDGVQEYPFAEPWQWVAPTGRLAGPLSPSVHFRHGGRANVAWCDGHVTAEKPARIGEKNFYGGDDAKHRLGWFGPSEENGYWNPRYEPKP